MKLPRRRILQLAAGAAALPAMSRLARAQAYPSRPITMVVPFAAAGRPTRSRASWPSGCGRRSASPSSSRTRPARRHDRRRPRRPRGARRLHDQHRPLEHACGQRRDLSAALRRAERFRADLAGRGQCRSSSWCRKALPAERPEGADRLAEGQSRTRLSQGTAGVGSASHVGGVYFQKPPARVSSSCPIAAPARRCRTWSPDRSTSMFDQAANSLPQVRDGNDQGLCRHGRSASAVGARHPDGGRGRHARLLHRRSGTALWVPKGTPKDIIARLNAAVVEALADPAVRAGSPISARRFRRASSRRRRRSAPSTRPRSRSGGRSSRPRTSRASDLQNFIDFVAQIRLVRSASSRLKATQVA